MQVLPVAQSWKNGPVMQALPVAAPCRSGATNRLPCPYRGPICSSTWKMQALPVAGDALPLECRSCRLPRAGRMARSGAASRDRPLAGCPDLEEWPGPVPPAVIVPLPVAGDALLLECRSCRLPTGMQTLPVAQSWKNGPVRCRQPRSSRGPIGFSTWNMQVLPVVGDALPLECRSCRLPRAGRMAR